MVFLEIRLANVNISISYSWPPLLSFHILRPAGLHGLDMYRHGKESWMVDVLLRLVVCLAVAGIVWGIKKAVSKHGFPTKGE